LNREICEKDFHLGFCHCLLCVRVKLKCNENGDVQPDIPAQQTCKLKINRRHHGDARMKKAALFVAVELV